jgi:hypothetical protein
VRAYGPISGESKKQRKQAKLPKSSSSCTHLLEAKQPEQPALADEKEASEKLPALVVSENTDAENEETAGEIKAETNDTGFTAEGNESSGSEKLSNPADSKNTGSEVEDKAIKSKTNEPDLPASVSRTSEQNTFFNPDDLSGTAFFTDRPPEPDQPP